MRYRNINKGAFAWALTTVLAAFGSIAALIAAWITHVVICIKSASWALLAIGAIVFPVGIVHGIGHWFGAF